MQTKARFCPSPTGRMHIGNVRTALFNWLFARAQGGSFLVRIEDTDKARSKQEYADLLLADLNRLGLHWDEGPQVSDDDAHYYQSARNHIYDNYFQQLVGASLAYPCFCTADALERTRKRQLASGQPPRYPGTCARLSTEDIAARRAQGITEVLRFSISDDVQVDFVDHVRGQQHFSGKDLGDFIIRKQDGTPTFMFSNAVDDALMQVTLVMRGEDHLTNTPRQILLLQALNLPQPQYAHLSIVLGNDGAPLSKRNGSVSLNDMLDQGYHPLAVSNYLARLGHVYADNNLLDMSQLAAGFSESKLVKSASRYDTTQLDFWQKKTIESLSNSDLAQWIDTELAGYVEEYSPEQLAGYVRHNMQFPSDIAPWLAMLNDDYLVGDAAQEVIEEAGKEFFQQAAAIIQSDDYTQQGWKDFTSQLQQSTQRKGKQLFLPLRAALTGQVTGPGLPELVRLVGQQRASQRFLRCV